MGLKGKCPTISRDFSKMKDFGLLQLAEIEFGLEMKTSHLQRKFGTFIANRNFTQFYALLRKFSINYRYFTQIIDILRKFSENYRFSRLEIASLCIYA